MNKLVTLLFERGIRSAQKFVTISVKNTYFNKPVRWLKCTWKLTCYFSPFWRKGQAEDFFGHFREVEV